MKYLLLIFLVACSPYHKQKPDYSLPPELKDCKVFEIYDGDQELYVVKCPSEQPSITWIKNCGKNCYTKRYSKVVYER